VKARDLVYVGLFGALWGALEMTLGAYLHTLLPAGAAPLVGPVMAALGIAVALVGRQFVPRRGAILMIGLIAALLKLVSLGGVRWGPLLGILIEAALVELVLLVVGRPRRLAHILAGALAVGSTLGQRFLFAPLFLGSSIGEVWEKLVGQGSALFGGAVRIAIAIVLLLLAIELLLGALAGELAWQVGRTAVQRLSRRWEEEV
jgi:hypothetical protein